MQAYINKEFITAIHLLVPQFEEAIRNLIEFQGGNILTYKEDGSFNLKLLNHLFDDPIVKEVFDEDIIYFFKILFTDKRGLNWRNKLAHGIVYVDDFTPLNTEIILLAIFTLGFVRKV